MKKILKVILTAALVLLVAGAFTGAAAAEDTIPADEQDGILGVASVLASMDPEFAESMELLGEAVDYLGPGEFAKGVDELIAASEPTDFEILVAQLTGKLPTDEEVSEFEQLVAEITGKAPADEEGSEFEQLVAEIIGVAPADKENAEFEQLVAEIIGVTPEELEEDEYEALFAEIIKNLTPTELRYVEAFMFALVAEVIAEQAKNTAGMGSGTPAAPSGQGGGNTPSGGVPVEEKETAKEETVTPETEKTPEGKSEADAGDEVTTVPDNSDENSNPTNKALADTVVVDTIPGAVVAALA